MVVQHVSLPAGQQQARTRWGTHVSGEVFDRKKSSYLTDDAQKFIAQQALCAIAGLDVRNRVHGLLALDIPGFVQVIDAHTCLLRLDGRLRNSPVIQRLHLYKDDEQEMHLGLFFICHPTKERLCVQGAAELLEQPSYPLVSASETNAQRECIPQSFLADEDIWIHLHVRQAFFHCAKYIKTHIPGLTHPLTNAFEQEQQWSHIANRNHFYLSEDVRSFLAEQKLCYLCTVDSEGQCAINHRGGAKGFLVTLSPDVDGPRGMILLPDYTGNGAFEAIGNILETRQAAMIVPDFASQMACCISGSAKVLELCELTPELAQKCAGAERVVALTVEQVAMQSGNWSAALAYECIRAERLFSERMEDES